jgi:hypothetical protein
MTRYFNKLSRLAVVAILAGVSVPQTASADGGGRGVKSFRNLGSGNSSSMKLQSQPQMKMLKSPSQMGKFNKSVAPFKVPSSGLKTGLNGQVVNKPTSPIIKTSPVSNVKLNPNILNSGGGKGTKVTPINKKWQDKIFTDPGKIVTKPGNIPTVPVGGQGGVITPFPGGKPPKADVPIKPLPTGPIANPFPDGKPPKIDVPIKPLPTGPIVNPFPPKPQPPIDPGPGNGNPGGGQPKPPKDHCHHKCPWPVFWPIYGNNNYWSGNCYNGPAYCPPTVVVTETPVVVNDVTTAVAPTPVVTTAATATTVSTASVDLVLEDVQYIEPATLLVGPAYRVKFRNQGMEAAGKFRVALVASVGGQVTETSPMALVDVAGLASGESGEVTVRLPKTALEMTSAEGQKVAFTHLLVAADFDNAVAESEKTNNVAIIERTQLEVASR